MSDTTVDKAPTTTTQVIKLTAKQFKTFIDTRDATARALQAYQAAQERFNDIGALILDAHGFAADVPAQVDERNQSLVVQVPCASEETDAAPAAEGK